MRTAPLLLASSALLLTLMGSTPPPPHSGANATVTPVAGDPGWFWIETSHGRWLARNPAPPAPDAPLEVRGENPSKTALLRYALSHDATVTLRIYDLQGRMVRGLVDSPNRAGSVNVQWDGRDDFGSPAGGGVYFARNSVDRKLVNTKKLVIR